MYQPANAVVRFLKYFGWFILFAALISLLLQIRFDVSRSLFPAVTLGLLFTYLNRPHQIVVKFAGREAFVKAVKETLVHYYDIADQSETYLYFRPTALGRLIAEPFIVELQLDSNTATIKGAKSVTERVRSKLTKAGVLL